MELKRFASYLINEGYKKTKKGINVFEPALVTAKEGEEYSGGRKLHHELANALNHNGKNMFYSFDLTNRCNRGCPGCYVDRAKEISCNAVSDIPIKEYKGDLKKWEAWADKSPANRKILEDTKKDINENGGIRMFSAADYPDASDHEYVKIMKDAKINDTNFFKNNVKAFLDDAQATGWHTKAITKELNFLKDHIHHPALKGVDVSMNAQGFGESHEVVKALRSGKHNDKKLTEPDQQKLNTIFDKSDAKRLAQHADKIIGRTVTHTPFDLTKLLEHKDDHAHIGVITSGHDIPGNGIRYVPSIPKSPFSPKTIILQVNFPETLMHILNGDTKASIEQTKNALNEYSKKYNSLRDKASNDLKKGTIQVLDVKDQHPITEGEELEVQPIEGDEATDAVQPEVAKKAPKIKQPKAPEHRMTTTLHRGQDGKWMQVTYKSSNGQRMETKANLIPKIEEEFDRINPPFTHQFTEQDAEFLMSKMEGNMCCAGADAEGQAAKGKCHTCKSKCGVKGCGSNKEGKKEVIKYGSIKTPADKISPKKKLDINDDEPAKMQDSKFAKYLTL